MAYDATLVGGGQLGSVVVVAGFRRHRVTPDVAHVHASGREGRCALAGGPTRCCCARGPPTTRQRSACVCVRGRYCARDDTPCECARGRGRRMAHARRRRHAPQCQCAWWSRMGAWPHLNTFFSSAVGCDTAVPIPSRFDMYLSHDIHAVAVAVEATGSGLHVGGGLFRRCPSAHGAHPTGCTRVIWPHAGRWQGAGPHIARH
jgi:hypothetical protein